MERTNNRRRTNAYPAKTRITLTALTVLLVTLPFMANNYWLDVSTTALFYTVLALGLNIVVGYAGLLDLGYAAFFAIGAYTTGILTTQYHVNFWITFLLAGLIAAVAGVIIGAPTLRLRSDYLAIVTLGFGEIVRITATNLQVTGSASGIYGISSPNLGAISNYLGVPATLYYLIFALALLTLLFVIRLGNSRIGRAWKYIREDEDAAEAMGIHRVRVKLTAYALGAMIGGFAGAFFAVKLSAISPDSFSFTQSVMILLAIVLGGLGRLPGVILGAVVITFLPELMREFASWRLLLFGLLLVAMMIVRPQGLWPVKRDTAETEEPGVS